jgi:sulfur-carrier protein adenylyltransferase/sulfurtransferase
MNPWHPAQRTAALAEIAAYLTSTYPSVRPLTEPEAARYESRGLVAAWRLGSVAPMPEIDVIIPALFPYALPRIALVEHDRDTPHTERDGVLCLEQDNAAIDHGRPVGVVEYELARAAQLYSELQSGQHNDDLLRDFERYWSHYGTSAAFPVLSLLEGTPATAYATRMPRLKQVVVIGPSPQSAERWLQNLTGMAQLSDRVPVVVCPLTAAPTPSQYPGDGGELVKLLDGLCTPGADLIRTAAQNWPRELIVLLSLRRPGAPDALGAIRLDVGLSRSQAKRRQKSGQTRQSVSALWLSMAQVERAMVERAEAAWVHGRYTDNERAALSKKRVAVVGVGSVGGRVAQLLAQAGAGNLVLIDPDKFALPNAARHLLGEDSFRESKAEAAAATLRRNLPHHDHIGAFQSTWQRVFESTSGVLTDADLIVSVTGDWNADAALSDLQHSGRLKTTVLYGWVEPHACASHGLVLKSDGPCLRCHFSAAGVADRRVTDWPEAIERVGTCGAIHTPFGAPYLGFTQSLLATMAIDLLTVGMPAGEWHVWSLPEREIRRRGGAVNQRWRDTFGELASEPCVQRLEWRQSALCGVCRASVR